MRINILIYLYIVKLIFVFAFVIASMIVIDMLMLPTEIFAVVLFIAVYVAVNTGTRIEKLIAERSTNSNTIGSEALRDTNEESSEVKDKIE